MQFETKKKKMEEIVKFASLHIYSTFVVEDVDDYHNDRDMSMHLIRDAPLLSHASVFL